MDSKSLFRLCVTDRPRAVEYIVSHPSSVDDLLKYETDMGNTILHIVSEIDDFAFACTLLNLSSDTSVITRGGPSPFDVAVKCGSEDTLRVYLSYPNVTVTLHNLEQAIMRHSHSILDTLVDVCLKQKMTTLQSHTLVNQNGVLMLKDDKREVCILRASLIHTIEYAFPYGVEKILDSLKVCGGDHTSSKGENIRTLDCDNYINSSQLLVYLLARDYIDPDRTHSTSHFDINNMRECVRILLQRGADPLYAIRIGNRGGQNWCDLNPIQMAVVCECENNALSSSQKRTLPNGTSMEMLRSRKVSYAWDVTTKSLQGSLHTAIKYKNLHVFECIIFGVVPDLQQRHRVDLILYAFQHIISSIDSESRTLYIREPELVSNVYERMLNLLVYTNSSFILFDSKRLSHVNRWSRTSITKIIRNGYQSINLRQMSHLQIKHRN